MVQKILICDFLSQFSIRHQNVLCMIDQTGFKRSGEVTLQAKQIFYFLMNAFDMVFQLRFFVYSITTIITFEFFKLIMFHIDMSFQTVFKICLKVTLLTPKFFQDQRIIPLKQRWFRRFSYVIFFRSFPSVIRMFFV